MGNSARMAEPRTDFVTRPLARDPAMTSDRWRRVQDVLTALIECPVDERDRLLAEQCDGDAALVHEVMSLLAAHDRTGPVDALGAAVAPAHSWTRAQAAGWEGRTVGRYEVGELLGAGGMGIVYRARDERLGRNVALKFLSPHLNAQPGAAGRFLAEARAAAALDHPNVCAIHDSGETEDGHLFMAMPLYDGETLQARLERGRLPFAEAATIALQAARGLTHAHERAIVHRDVKPSNIMLVSDGTVKILDFGIATADDPAAVGYRGLLGTVAYMSPEHVRGDTVDHRTDIWSLGVVIHEMLTGSRPFAGDDRQSVTDAILAKDPDLFATSYPDVPSATDDVLGRALAKDPNDRYPSMAAFAARLGRLASAGQVRERRRENRSEAALVSDRIPERASEKRRVTVLATTLSGYSSLVEHLPSDSAQRLVADVRDLVVEVVRRHGGVVNQALGEETLSLFGVPTAHEDDELRAVRAALELHARVRELAATTAANALVSVKSGIHAGPAVVQRLSDGPRRYSVVGSPVQAAFQLAALAAADEVLLSPDCQRLVAPYLRTTECATVALDIDGVRHAPFLVTGETGVETRLEASERSGLTPYVGRESALAWLEGHVGAALAGHGRVVAVAGEAGAGKSRLVYELRERLAHNQEVRVLQGRCRAYGDVTPYFPFVEVLRHALGAGVSWTEDEAHALVERLRAIDPSLEPFIPLYLHLLAVPTESHQLPRHLQGEHLQATLLGAMARLLTVVARPRTLIVLLEDWHWADDASRTALERLREIVSDEALLFVVTMRPEGGILDRWPADLQLQLEPLDFAATAAIMRSVLQVDRVSDTLARRVFERTGGNPFFVEQVCRALLEQGAVSPREGEAVVEGAAGELSLPDTVQAVIRSRLDRLDRDSQEVLRVAATIGREFEHALLADVLDPHVDLPHAISRLTASGLIQRVGERSGNAYRFWHVLTQEVSYEGLLAHQKRSLHAEIGRAIEVREAHRIDETAAPLAHHFERGESWPEAVRYGRRAAERAIALSQFADALAMLDRVLAWVSFLPDTDERRDLHADVLLQQERVCETLGFRSRQRTIVESLITLLAPRGPSARLAQAYLRRGDLQTSLKHFDAADRSLATALRISRERGDTDLERAALRSVGLLRWYEGRHAEALVLTEDALAIDRANADDLAVAGDLANICSILRSLGHYETALARIEEALAMPVLAEDPKTLVYALHRLASVHRSLGNPDRALDTLRGSDEITKSHLLPIQRSFHLTSIAHLELEQGHVEAAISAYEEAIDFSRRARHAEGLVHALRTLGEVLFGFERYDEALPRLREAAEIFAQLEDRPAEADTRSMAAAATEWLSPSDAVDAWQRVSHLRQQLGDPGGELDALEGIARSVRAADPSPLASIPAFESALDLALRLGRTDRLLPLHNSLGILEWQAGRNERAVRHYEAALLVVRDQHDTVHEGLILNSLGVTLARLDRLDEARTVLEESVTLNQKTGQQVLEAHALSALGGVSRRTGRLDEARQLFDRSLALRRARGDLAGEGWMHVRLAEVLAGMGNSEAARVALNAATIVADELNDAALKAACARTSTDAGLSEQE
jgi:serine/threonine protein kinase/predicted ATPase